MPTESPRRSAQILRFTTHGIAPTNRVQLWEGHNARALIPLDIHTIDDAPMVSQQTNLHLPSVRMANVKGSSQIVERSESFINENPTGVMAVFFAVEGDAFFFHRGAHPRCARARPWSTTPTAPSSAVSPAACTNSS